jgi:hypothetical protein
MSAFPPANREIQFQDDQGHPIAAFVLPDHIHVHQLLGFFRCQEMRIREEPIDPESRLDQFAGDGPITCVYKTAVVWESNQLCIMDDPTIPKVAIPLTSPSVQDFRMKITTPAGSTSHHQPTVVIGFKLNEEMIIYSTNRDLTLKELRDAFQLEYDSDTQEVTTMIYLGDVGLDDSQLGQSVLTLRNIPISIKKDIVPKRPSDDPSKSKVPPSPK